VLEIESPRRREKEFQGYGRQIDRGNGKKKARENIGELKNIEVT
jgi:hypothetical protein